MCQEQGNSGVDYCFINVAVIHGALFLAFEYSFNERHSMKVCLYNASEGPGVKIYTGKTLRPLGLSTG